MWHVIILRIMQCAIGTRNHETTVSAEDARYRHMTAYNTEKDSSAIKDLTSHTNTEAMLQCYAMYQICLREYFCHK